MPTAPSRPGIISSKFYLCGVEKAVILLLFCVQLFGTPRTVASQAPLSTISQGLLKFLSIESVMLSHPLLPPSPFAFYLAQQQSLFQGVSSSHQVAKVLDSERQNQSFQ